MFVIDLVLLAALLVASRVSFRLIGEFLQRNRKTARRVVVYGAGGGGALAVRELTAAEETPYRILGFADDDPRKQRMRVQGYPVLGGYDSVRSLVEASAVDLVVISARLIDVDRLRSLEALCGDHGVALSRLRVGLEPIVMAEDDPTQATRRGRARQAAKHVAAPAAAASERASRAARVGWAHERRRSQ